MKKNNEAISKVDSKVANYIKGMGISDNTKREYQRMWGKFEKVINLPTTEQKGYFREYCKNVLANEFSNQRENGIYNKRRIHNVARRLKMNCLCLKE